ncbi:class I SAM-dependent methyltransferase [Rhodobacteraceae bacterium]|nr:class I SAM-dependent methyltransferase [Paracoccaceae bacterium]
MSDRKTLSVYDAKADEYAGLTTSFETDRHLDAFMEALPTGGRVLDLGCGPGRAAKTMADAGFDVTAWDASPEMARFGRETFDLDIEVKTFADLNDVAVYDGIYANFSLLHSPKSEMPSHLTRIATALRPQGQFHIGTKTGTGEKRDGIGRFYTYYADAELTDLLGAVGLSVQTRATGSDAGLDGVVAPWIIIRAKRDS